MEINIETAVRICPVNNGGSNGNNVVCLQANTNTNTIELGNSQSFPVNYALPSHCSQTTLYTTVITPLLNFLIEGCDISVVALGQSETGKTYSLFGPGFHFAASEAEHGIIPRFIRELYTKIKQYRDRNYVIHVTWSQICGESVQDLLGAGSVECADILEAFQLIQLGLSNRAPKCAHTLFTITLEQEWVIDNNVQHRVSTASFTDLASSEKVVVYDNNGLMQSLPTDSGLLALQQCITALSEQYYMNYGNINNIPYGHSVLTTLLKDSFGGRAKTILLCTVSPLIEDFSETLYTLQMASRTQSIKNFVTVNSYTTFQNIQESCDIFGLQFATNQLLKLVTNAEELFQKLLMNSSLPKGELEQISRWLTFKQECEECISENSEPHRSLDIIEEEEAEENTSCDSNNSSDIEDIDEDQEQESQQNDIENVQVLLKNFTQLTDEIVNKNNQESRTLNSNMKESFGSSSHEYYARYHNKGARGRRVSIHSAEELGKSLSIDSKCEGAILESDEKACETDGLTYEMKKKLLKKIKTVIQNYEKQISDLQKTNQAKERLKQQLIENKDVNDNAKMLLKKLNKERDKIMSACSQAEGNKDHDSVKKYKTKLADLKKKIKDAESLKIITEESNQNLLETENSIHTSRRQLEKLEKCKRKEEKRKNLFESQLREEKKKMETSGDSFDKPKSSTDTKNSNENKQLVVFKYSSPLKLSQENIESERHEIRNLRKTRDYLLEQRYKIDTKSLQKRIMNEIEERKLLQYEEAIEAIDLVMEYKNEILCGRIPFVVKSLDYIEEEADKMLMERLMKLSEKEMRILLYKYFQKIVEIRNSSKKLELQVVDIENQNENLCCRIQNLSHILQQVRLESERRIIALQKKIEDNLQIFMRYLTGDVSKRTLAFNDKTFMARYTRIDKHESVPKQLQATLSVPQAAVTRERNKLFIQQRDNEKDKSLKLPNPQKEF